MASFMVKLDIMRDHKQVRDLFDQLLDYCADLVNKGRSNGRLTFDKFAMLVFPKYKYYSMNRTMLECYQRKDEVPLISEDLSYALGRVFEKHLDFIKKLKEF